MRRLLCLSIVAALLAVVAAGCGTSSTSDQLDTALSYMPKSSALVVAINTDLNSDQAKQVGNLIKRVPQGSQLLGAAKTSISRNGIDFDKDLKPLLGNDLVVAIPTAQDLRQSNSPTIEAIQTKNGSKAKEVIAKGSTKVGSRSAMNLPTLWLTHRLPGMSSSDFRAAMRPAGFEPATKGFKSTFR